MTQKKVVALSLGVAAIAAAVYFYKKNKDTKAVTAAKNEELAIANQLPSTATPGILPASTFAPGEQNPNVTKSEAIALWRGQSVNDLDNATL